MVERAKPARALFAQESERVRRLGIELRLGVRDHAIAQRGHAQGDVGVLAIHALGEAARLVQRRFAIDHEHAGQAEHPAERAEAHLHESMAHQHLDGAHLGQQSFVRMGQGQPADAAHGVPGEMAHGGFQRVGRNHGVGVNADDKAFLNQVETAIERPGLAGNRAGVHMPPRQVFAPRQGRFRQLRRLVMRAVFHDDHSHIAIIARRRCVDGQKRFADLVGFIVRRDHYGDRGRKGAASRDLVAPPAQHRQLHAHDLLRQEHARPHSAQQRDRAQIIGFRLEHRRHQNGDDRRNAAGDEQQAVFVQLAVAQHRGS